MREAFITKRFKPASLEEGRRAEIVEIAERYDDLRENWDEILELIG